MFFIFIVHHCIACEGVDTTRFSHNFEAENRHVAAAVYRIHRLEADAKPSKRYQPSGKKSHNREIITQTPALRYRRQQRYSARHMSAGTGHMAR